MTSGLNRALSGLGADVRGADIHPGVRDRVGDLRQDPGLVPRIHPDLDLVQDLRVSVPVYMARPYVRTQEGLIGEIPQEMLDRNPARFAILTQQSISYGYKSQEDSIARAARAMEFAKAYTVEEGGPLLGSRSLYS